MTFKKFNVGDQVKSFDFPGMDDCFVEGVVVKVDENFLNYDVYVTRQVVTGKEVPHKVGMVVHPPFNGLSGFFGPTNGVIAL